MADGSAMPILAKQNEKVISTKAKEKPKRKIFRWNSESVEHLIDSLLEYKAEMDFKAIDFQSDKPKMYDEIRRKMAKIYNKSNDEGTFGPEKPLTLDFNSELPQEQLEQLKFKIKKQKEEITKGRNRIQEKIKEIRRGYSKAVLNGTRSGSGKVVYEYFDKLVLIWGGSASAEALSYGISTESIEQEGSISSVDINDDSLHELSSVENFEESLTTNETLEIAPGSINDKISDEEGMTRENENITKKV